MSKRTFGDLMHLARVSCGISQKDLHGKTGIDQATLSKLENDVIAPSGDYLASLSRELRRPVSFFQQNVPYYGRAVSVHSFRKKSAVRERELAKEMALVDIALIHLSLLFRYFTVSPLLVPDFSRRRSTETVGELAADVRSRFNMPPGPVGNLTTILEDHGVVVFFTDFSGVDIDGLTIAPPELPPCVFVNSKRPADRQRFTLAHELGHLVLHRTLHEGDIETEANEFASAFLMPKEDIQEELKGTAGIARYAALKPKWRVAIAALAMRAKALNFISEYQSRQLWKRLSSLGYRKTEPPELSFPADEPVLLPTMFQAALVQLGGCIDALAEYLCIYVDDLKYMYPFIETENAGDTA